MTNGEVRKRLIKMEKIIKLLNRDILYPSEEAELKPEGKFITFSSVYTAENGTKYHRKYKIPMTSIAYIEEVDVNGK